MRVIQLINGIQASRRAISKYGPVVAGKSLADAVFATEELEETAKLFLLLKDRKISPLTVENVLELKRKFPNPI